MGRLPSLMGSQRMFPPEGICSNLPGGEIFLGHVPGLGLATLISQMICIGGPYVIYLGATDLKLPYAVMFLVCIAGFVATLFLPETLDRKLPETIEEASSFGAKDKFFSFRPGRYERARERDEDEDTAEAGDMLNKKSDCETSLDANWSK